MACLSRGVCGGAAAAVMAVSLIGILDATAQDRGYIPPSSDTQGPRSISPPDRERDSRGPDAGPGYGQPYSAPKPDAYRPRDAGPPAEQRDYSEDEVLDAGRLLFGSVSEGLARVVEHAFRKQGRPNGYILGEEGSGAFVAGLRYGEGVLHTKYSGNRKVYWQGPSIGYDFGANGSKTLTLVYNLRDIGDIYERFAGVDGSAYFVAGAGVTFQQHDDVILAPIRSGVGLRLGANVGYLKYTSSPTWNPF